MLACAVQIEFRANRRRRRCRMRTDILSHATLSVYRRGQKKTACLPCGPVLTRVDTISRPLSDVLAIPERAVLSDLLFTLVFLQRQDSSSISFSSRGHLHQRSRCLRAWSDMATKWLHIPTIDTISYYSVRTTCGPVATYDTIPDIYDSSGGSSSVDEMSNVASIPAIINHTLAWAKKRPGHRRAPKPNAGLG